MDGMWVKLGEDLTRWLGPSLVGALGVAIIWGAGTGLMHLFRSLGTTALPVVAVAFSLPTSSVPSKASERRSALPPKDGASSPPPGSEPGGPSNSPPLPARTGDIDEARVGVSPDGHEAETDHLRTPHPAIHGNVEGEVVPLFPRAPRREPDPETRRREREDAMRRHPAGKGLLRATEARPVDGSKITEEGDASTTVRYRVKEGDTLWGIAERHLDTSDVRRIARYWPRIHRANRSVIHDPSHIEPGWELLLPLEDRR